MDHRAITHPDSRTIRAFANGRLDARRADEVERHLLGCEACAHALEDSADGLFLARLRFARAGGEAVTLPDAATRLPGAGLPHAPDGYQVERELGRGGMGVVFLARQTRLKRQVALKMILHGGFADEGVLTRFRIEAEAVARLQHPGIVQIHEVGEHAGLPWFSLEYCPGGSLDHYLCGQPLSVAAAATLGESVARAVAAAHAKGVIHRDLKPANILLGGDGEPKVADFGLARLSGTDEMRTRTGAVMGTPSYMAPEQASGDPRRVGPAADVYSLGAVLYECLTGRPPFRGATALETIDQIRTLDPVPPRRLNPDVPRDLETVCLKCLSKEPHHRYPSAEALADDLGRFTRGEPVVARPVGTPGRVWRWAKRNRLPATLLAVSVLALVGGSVASSLFALDAQASARQSARDKQLADASAALAQRHEAEAVAARQRADDDRERVVKALVRERAANEKRDSAEKLSRVALDTMTSTVVEDLLERQPSLTPTQRQYLETCVKLYEAYAADSTPTEANRTMAADAQRRVGALLMRLGDPKATVAYDKAGVQYRRLVADFPTNHLLQVELGRCLVQAALVQRIAGRFDAAIAQANEGAELLRVVAAGSTDWRLRAEYARHCHLRAQLFEAVGRRGDAETACAASAAFLASLQMEHPDDGNLRIEYAYCLTTLGSLRQNSGRYREAEKVYREADELLVTPSTDPVGEHSRVTLLGRTRMALGLLSWRRGAADDGLKFLGDAAEIFRTQAAAFPNVPQHRADLCACLLQTGVPLGRLARYQEAADSFLAALAAARQLMKETSTPDARLHASQAATGLGKSLAHLGKPDEAERFLREGLTTAEQLVKDFPTVSHYPFVVAHAGREVGNFLLGAGRDTEAERVFRVAVAVWEKVAKDPAEEEERYSRAQCRLQLGGLILRGNRVAEAGELLTKAEAEYAALHTAAPERSEYASGLAMSRATLAGVYLRTGRVPLADATLRASVLPGEQVVAAGGPEAMEQTELLTDTFCTIGQIAAFADKKPKESLAWFAKALAVLRTLPSERLLTGNGRQYFINTLEGRARALVLLGRHAEAIPDFARALDLAAGQDKPYSRQLYILTLAQAGQSAKAVAEAEHLLGAGRLLPIEVMFGVAHAFATVEITPGVDPVLAAKAGKHAENIVAGFRDRGLLRGTPAGQMIETLPEFAGVRDRLAKTRGNK